MSTDKRQEHKYKKMTAYFLLPASILVTERSLFIPSSASSGEKQVIFSSEQPLLAKSNTVSNK